MKFHASIFATAAIAALLSACGGSGSDDTSSPSGGTKTVAISTGNQADVARAAVNGGLSLALVQTETGGDTTVSPTSAGAVGAERALQRVLSAAVNQRRGIASAAAHPAATTSSTDACGVSGTLATSWNDVDNNSQLSAGDIITANFQQCVDTATLSINGSLVITLTGSPTETQFTANASFQNIAIVYQGLTYSMTGSVSLSEVDTNTVSSSSFTVGTGGLTVAIASTGYSDSIAYDAGMTVSSSFVAGSNALTMTGSFVAQSIGGRVTVATVSPLIQQSGATFPNSGSFRVTGDAGSALLVTAVNTTSLTLQLDANGDGTYEGNANVLWTSLVP